MKLRNAVACNSKTHAEYSRDGRILYDNCKWMFQREGQPSALVIIDDGIKQDGILYLSCGDEEYNFSDYADDAKKTAVYPGQGTFVGLMYVSLKGSGEAGKFAENVGKALRDDNIALPYNVNPSFDNFQFGNLTPERQTKLIGELGDELWYIAAKCDELGVRLVDVALSNRNKLRKRATEGKIQGSGSDR